MLLIVLCAACNDPEEWSEYEDVKKGADVLLNLIMELGKEEEK